MTNDSVTTPPPPDRALGARLARAVRRATPWLLGGAVVAFVLPFAAVSCATPAGYGSAGGGVTATYAGLTLVTGGEPGLDPADRPLPPGAAREEDRVAPQPAAAGGFLLAAAALALAMTGGSRPRFPAVAVLAAGAVGLTVRAYAEFDRLRTGRIMAKLAALTAAPRPPAEVDAFVQPERGFWIAVALLVTAAVLNAAAGLARRPQTVPRFPPAR